MLIGIDVGTTSVKAALFDAQGRTARNFASTYPTHRQGAIIEQNPDDWMRLVWAALEALTAGVNRGAISAVGLCSQVNTHVFVGDKGEPLLPAIVWQDGRCAAEAVELSVRAGQPFDASHVLARMAWVTRRHPDVWAKTRWVMAPKDYCIFKLTGAVVADPLTAFGMVDGLVPGAAERLPPVAGFTAPAGRIHGLDLPMVVGTMDAWSSLLGAGVSQGGEAVYLSGTSEVAGIVSARKISTPGVITFPECEGIVLHAGPTQAGGASIEWLSQIIGRSVEELSTLVAGADASRATPIFLPHLQGERAPLWDIAARAAFAGIDSSMGPAELARAVFEGVAYSVRLLLMSLEQSADCHVEALNLSGGGARSDIWCQIRADVLGRPLRRTANLDSGVLGAAMLAGIGIGEFGSIQEAATSMVRFERMFDPDPSRRARHEFGFGKYVELYQKLKSFNAGF